MPDATDADPPRQDADADARRDEVLRRMLTTPRKPKMAEKARRALPVEAGAIRDKFGRTRKG